MAATDNTSVPVRTSGLLYPMMLIAAIAVIVFSVVGIATMMGWMPRALSGSSTAGSAMAPAGGAQPSGAVSRADAVAPAPAPAPAAGGQPDPPAARTESAPLCAQCGVVEWIRAVEVPGESTWVGAAGGAAVGALVGSQVGSGRGKMLASGVGAGAGAYAGTQIEPHLRKSVKYQVQVRMEDGKMHTFTRSQQPAFSVGQRVRVTDRGIVAE